MPGRLHAQAKNRSVSSLTRQLWPAKTDGGIAALHRSTANDHARLNGVAIGQGALKGTVLIVDDDAILLMVVAEILNKMGYQAITASSGFEALNTLKVCPVDLVLTDFQMPGMDGLELARRIKEMDLDIPIVMMTGLSGADVDEMLTSGFIDDMLLKPFPVEAVNRLLVYLLAEHFRSLNYA